MKLLIRGANQSKGDVPDQFIVASESDFHKQLDKILETKSCVVKTVVLPPGVTLDDPRLNMGEVVEERHYKLPLGDKGIWPADAPFEVDISSRLIPPAYGEPNKGAHYSVFPDSRFANDSKCGVCDNYSKRQRQFFW